MSERTALEIADKLDYFVRSVMSIRNVLTLPNLCDCGEKAADMLRQQHAEIERLRADLAKDAAPDLLSVCQQLAEVNVFSVESEVASIIMLALDAVEKATGGKA